MSMCRCVSLGLLSCIDSSLIGNVAIVSSVLSDSVSGCNVNLVSIDITHRDHRSGRARSCHDRACCGPASG